MSPFTISLLSVCAAGAVLLHHGLRDAPDLELDLAHPGLARLDGRLTLDGQPFTGRTIHTRFDGTVLREEWAAGRRHGASTVHHANGRLAETRTYRDGRKSGTHLGFWDDGTPKFHYEFANGLHEGDAIEWYPDGSPLRSFHYEDGKESGAQRWWNPDGSIRANYVVRDGRRFGLIGTKGCTSQGAGADR